MTFGSLFSGIGGIDLGLERVGMECRWQVEIDPYSAKVLAKHWPQAMRYRDVRTVAAFDEEGWQLIDVPEPVELICGGFPCQDISTAGRGIGIVGSRSGLWAEFARLVAELRPRCVFVENVPALRSRGLALVLQDLLSLGFDAEWHCIPASALGAPHERDRIWIVAYAASLFGAQIVRGEPQRDVQENAPNADRRGFMPRTGGAANRQNERQAKRRQFGGDSQHAHSSFHGRKPRLARRSNPGYSWQREQAFQISDSDGAGLEEPQHGEPTQQPAIIGSAADDDGEPLVRAAIARGERSAWTVEPGVVRMVYGVSHRVDRLRGLGNAVVPQVAEWIGRRIMEAFEAPQGKLLSWESGVE